MSTVTVEYVPAFVETVNLRREFCATCGHLLSLTPNTGQQVGEVSTTTTGLPEIALYHFECAPEALRAANRQDEIQEFEAMLENDEEKTCAYMTHPGSRNPDHPEPPEYCDELAEPDSEYCKGHEGAEGEGW